MTIEASRFATLMERVSQGDQQAATELFEQYQKAIIFVVRQRLNAYPQLRALFDSIDFLQEVSQDVFADPEKLRDFTTFEVLLKYLVEMARQKVQKDQRKYASQKRDRRRVRHLGDSGVSAAAAAIADARPSPAQRAAMSEVWLHWILSLPLPQRRIVLMLRDGCTYQEIAAEFDFSERSIRRIVAEIRGMPPPMPLPYL